MKDKIPLLLLCLALLTGSAANAQRISAGIDSSAKKGHRFFAAGHRYFQYTGRIDFTNKALPRFWQPGIYITTKFRGTSCKLFFNDEVLGGTSHNYIQVAVDGKPCLRIKSVDKANTIRFDSLRNGTHTLTICKGTEAGIGYLEFIGLTCEELLLPSLHAPRRIEFIGNSITCGAGSDLTAIPCDSGQWYDQHNAYDSYGAITARSLNAQCQLSSVSGIGLIHSCCNMKITMPRVFDKINMRDDKLPWNFKNYTPDVVTICLGQNDGIQDSAAFCSAYLNFLDSLRVIYPKAAIICLTSPMADASLTAVLKKYLSAVVATKKGAGDKNVYRYFFSRRYNGGCGNHPSLAEHRQIAKELTDFIKTVQHW